ncbi:MAG: sigma-70 family RNA polymerase sigma factor [Bacteroidetes bacterium]|nr:MAG: sigma-70 family RNA polymerase sigma factor [Bacteroidota bacterium]
MTDSLTAHRRIEQVIAQEREGLLGFIRRRLPDWEEAEDILQDVFYQFALREDAGEGIENAGAWLMTVARNRITDLYRKKRPENFSRQAARMGRREEGPLLLADILPDFSQDPEALFFRSLILDALEEALDSLPTAQREVFVWHEFEQKSFRDMAEETGLPINTLISRKRYAVLALRARLQDLYDSL